MAASLGLDAQAVITLDIRRWLAAQDQRLRRVDVGSAGCLAVET
jgi:hypothetical protein